MNSEVRSRTIGGVLRELQGHLARAGIPEAGLEAEVILKHVLGFSRAQLYSRLRDEFPEKLASTLAPLLARRLRREPLAYILGYREFYGLELAVDSRVLIPRPETELLVEAGLAFLQGLDAGGAPLVADVGTGCGAIAIAIAVHHPLARVYAMDLSSQALEVAGENCRRHGVSERVYLLRGDLLAPLPSPVYLILANLPYVKEGELARLTPEIAYEPPLALAGGVEGTALLKELFLQAPEKLLPGGCLIAEIGYGQGEALLPLAGKTFPGARVSLLRDLSGIERAIKIEIPFEPSP